ncbi:VanZ family protein [Agarivorans sp. TSD2052]|uniref:VanZ family protein n=1 Tax=Agarivorans sp. TSD2052 TaxID=2937286 RepID=UPI00201027DE|nr:VanZ family protein [Agarivorans sp. TSD2052]UPW18206.1 VanZ family protein [Agarivorans sp. TSD2052]
MIALKFRVLAIASVRLYWGAILVTIFALGEELSQAFIPHRTFDLIDASADMLGIAIASMSCFLINRYYANQQSKSPLSPGETKPIA